MASALTNRWDLSDKSVVSNDFSSVTVAKFYILVISTVTVQMVNLLYTQTKDGFVIAIDTGIYYNSILF